MMTKSWLFRLYALLSIGWVAWFAYEAYNANRQIVSASNFIQMYVYDRRAGRPSAYDFADLNAWQNEQINRFNSAIKAIPKGIGVGTIAFLSLEWVRRRRKSQGYPRERPTFEKRAEEIRQNRRGSRFQPASTPLLLCSIFFFPMLWLIDPTALANVWIARIKV